MARTWIRFGIVTMGLGTLLVSAAFLALGVQLIEGPQQHVGMHLEFGADPSGAYRAADPDLIQGACDSLPRLLGSTGARRVKVHPIDPATLEVTFDPPQPWSEVHGLRADGAEDAPLLLPDALLTLLTTTSDLRLLQVESASAANPVDRDRAARALDHHPERALDLLHTALHDAPSDGSAVAWIPCADSKLSSAYSNLTGADSRPSSADSNLPRADSNTALVPLRVEGDPDRRITVLDLANAKRASGELDLQLFVYASNRITHGPYLSDLAGRRVAIVVDGEITWLGDARADGLKQLLLVGDPKSTTSEACASILSHIHKPLLPLKPSITRSWIQPNHAAAGGVVFVALGGFSGMIALGMLWFFVREVRRPVVRPREMDWSSAS